MKPEIRIENYIRSYGNLKNLKSLTEIAKYLGYTKPTFTRKVRDDSFTRKEAGRMFKKLEFRDEDIVKLMKE